MPDAHVAVSQEASQYAAQRMAAAAAARAKRLWPGVIGEVLAFEVMAGLDLPTWLGPQTRTCRLIKAILEHVEEPPESRIQRPAA
jgi:hypothetical protein